MGKLTNYTGAIDLIDGIRQKNGGTFALMEANAIQVNDDDKRLDTELEDIKQSVSDIDIPQAANSAPKDLGLAAFIGSSDKWAREDHIHKLPDIPQAGTTTPQDLGAASVGTSTKWAREDHVHKLPDIPQAGTSDPQDLGTPNAGTSVKWAREDHVHKLPDIPKASDDTPKDLGTASSGTSNTWARSDHIHKLPDIPQAGTTTPQDLGVASVGVSNKWAREDHVHNKQTDVTGNAGTATKLKNKISISISGGASASAIEFDGSGNVALNVTSLDGTKITGVIPLSSIPKGAQERFVPVDNAAKRLTLTTNEVQNGDVVKENDTQLLYYVTDDTKLGSEDAFATFAAGAASSVEWNNVQNKPSFATVATSGNYTDLNNLPDIPEADDATPKALGIASAGTSTKWSRSDHIHPEQTKVKNDGNEQEIVSTYIKKVESDGTSLTLTKGNGTTSDVSLGLVAGSNVSLEKSEDGKTTIISSEKTTFETYTAVVGTTWSGEDPYIQTINIEGILATDIPIVDIVLNDGDDYITKLDDYNKLYRITANTGNIVVYATEKTTSEITIRLRCER